MKRIVFVAFMFIVGVCNAQEESKTQELTFKKANNYIFEGNELASKEDFVEAEMAYRKAISEQPSTVGGNYNLGNSYYEKGNYEEALFRHQQAIKHATSKLEKHMAYHNIGNILMQNKKCKEAVEAFKNALRNDPSDDETRYNLGLAKACAEQQKDQQDQNKDDENKDKNDENKDQQDQKDKQDQQDKKDQEGDNQEDQKNQDQGEDDKKEGEDQKDKDGEPKDEKEDKGKEGEKDQKKPQQPKPQPGQLSPQQVKSLLEAMNNQEQKVQDKINAEKQKGVKVKTEKDW
ncbi:tetratricopeptide repeat protein [Aestuariivivens insulae]|uniref:tetratricopeptide repeat protein n=1 Tax=Aestuariivivens insulae TaxID=1621988 RepID=UPI001F56DCCF|nr:tetratricopeptide repeat protein [Aestuariivivens insulae]